VTPEVISKHIAKRVPCLGNNSSFGKKVVLDAFCGVGGNAIGFALEKDISLVVCVDIDLNKLKMAAKNASVYNVDPGKIVFIEGDAIQVLNLYRNGKLLEQSSTTKDSSKKEICHGYTIHGLAALPVSIDCVFLSPPWGGTEYLKSGNDGYRLSCMKVMMTGTDQCDDKNDECSGDELLSKSAMAAKDKQVVCFLPRNINGFDVGTCAWKAGYTRQSHIELEQNILNAKLKAVTVYLH
jgi:trimethylguanosine synthase